MAGPEGLARPQEKHLPLQYYLAEALQLLPPPARHTMQGYTLHCRLLDLLPRGEGSSRESACLVAVEVSSVKMSVDDDEREEGKM